jgi:hypothetical protein
MLIHAKLVQIKLGYVRLGIGKAVDHMRPDYPYFDIPIYYIV